MLSAMLSVSFYILAHLIYIYGSIIKTLRLGPGAGLKPTICSALMFVFIIPFYRTPFAVALKRGTTFTLPSIRWQMLYPGGTCRAYPREHLDTVSLQPSRHSYCACPRPSTAIYHRQQLLNLCLCLPQVLDLSRSHQCIFRPIFIFCSISSDPHYLLCSVSFLLTRFSSLFHYYVFSFPSISFFQYL